MPGSKFVSFELELGMWQRGARLSVRPNSIQTIQDIYTPAVGTQLAVPMEKHTSSRYFVQNVMNSIA